MSAGVVAGRAVLNYIHFKYLALLNLDLPFANGLASALLSCSAGCT